MSNKLSNKEKNREMIEAKFNSSKSIAEIKNELTKNKELLVNEIQKNKNANKELAKSMKVEKKKLDEKLKKIKIKNSIEVAKQISLIKKNQSLIDGHRKSMKMSAKIHSSKSKSIIIERKKNMASDRAEVSKNLMEAKSKYKIDIARLKSSYEKNKFEINEKLKEYKMNLEKEKNELQRIIDIKIKELHNRKNELKIQRMKSIQTMRSLQNEKKMALKSMSIELKKELELQKKITQSEILDINIETQQEIHNIRNNKHKIEISNTKKETEKASKDQIRKDELIKMKSNISKAKLDINNTIYHNDKITKSMLEVNIDNVPILDKIELIRGNAVNGIRKSELKLFEKINKITSKVPIAKVRLPKEEINRINQFRDNKIKNQITDIRSFMGYANFCTDNEITIKELDIKIVSAIVAMYKGKVLSFINNYFWVEKIKGLKVVKTSKQLPKVSSDIVSLGQDEFIKKFEKVIHNKIKSGLDLKLSENIAITQIRKKIVVVTDTPFMR